MLLMVKACSSTNKIILQVYGTTINTYVLLIWKVHHFILFNPLDAHLNQLIYCYFNAL